jgi:hypothetical protein
MDENLVAPGSQPLPLSDFEGRQGSAAKAEDFEACKSRGMTALREHRLEDAAVFFYPISRDQA